MSESYSQNPEYNKIYSALEKSLEGIITECNTDSNNVQAISQYGKIVSELMNFTDNRGNILYAKTQDDSKDFDYSAIMQKGGYSSKEEVLNAYNGINMKLSKLDTIYDISCQGVLNGLGKKGGIKTNVEGIAFSQINIANYSNIFEIPALMHYMQKGAKILENSKLKIAGINQSFYEAYAKKIGEKKAGEAMAVLANGLSKLYEIKGSKNFDMDNFLDSKISDMLNANMELGGLVDINNYHEIIYKLLNKGEEKLRKGAPKSLEKLYDSFEKFLKKSDKQEEKISCVAPHQTLFKQLPKIEHKKSNVKNPWI